MIEIDFRALCAELLRALIEYGNDIHYHEYHELIQDAKTALDQSPAAESLSPREVEAQEAFIDNHTPEWV